MTAAATSLRTQWDALVHDVLNLFSNVLFAVSLFAVWGVLTLIGVIVDQGKDPSVYFAAYPAGIARLVLRLHFDNIYHSAQYVGIIGLILASLTACTFRRVIPARLPPLRAVKIDYMPLHATVRVRGAEDDIRSRVERFFGSHGWTVRKRELGGVEWTFADRHNWARRGVLVAHIGFVIIAAGTSIYWAKGFSGNTTVVSGSSTILPQTGARIALDRFSYRIDPIQTKAGTVYQPIDYVSHVQVTGKDGVTRPETIRSCIRQRTGSRCASRSRITASRSPVRRPGRSRRARASRSMARRARSSIASSSARSTTKRVSPGPTRDRTTPAWC
jgi:hypothetical protein